MTTLSDYSPPFDLNPQEYIVPTLAPHQERVVTEKADLDAKIMKLSIFVGSAAFKSVVPDTLEQGRMQRQLVVMSEYSSILGERIEAFTAAVA